MERDEVEKLLLQADCSQFSYPEPRGISSHAKIIYGDWMRDRQQLTDLIGKLTTVIRSQKGAGS